MTTGLLKQQSTRWAGLTETTKKKKEKNFARGLNVRKSSGLTTQQRAFFFKCQVNAIYKPLPAGFSIQM